MSFPRLGAVGSVDNPSSNRDCDKPSLLTLPLAPIATHTVPIAQNTNRHPSLTRQRNVTLTLTLTLARTPVGSVGSVPKRDPNQTPDRECVNQSPNHNHNCDTPER